jgi:hypothetical protein
MVKHVCSDLSGNYKKMAKSLLQDPEKMAAEKFEEAFEFAGGR